MTPWYLFPPENKPCKAAHDTAGWTLTSHAAKHPSNGADCQAFDVPEDTHDGEGCTLTMDGYKPLHGVLYLHLPTGAGLVVDVFPKQAPATHALPRLVVNGAYLSQDV